MLAEAAVATKLETAGFNFGFDSSGLPKKRPTNSAAASSVFSDEKRMKIAISFVEA